MYECTMSLYYLAMSFLKGDFAFFFGPIVHSYEQEATGKNSSNAFDIVVEMPTAVNIFQQELHRWTG